MRRRALVTVLVAVALLLIAATIRSGWLYLVASALLALVVLGGVSGRAAVRRIALERTTPGEVFEGEPFTARLRLSNRGRLASALVKVTDRQFAGRHPGLAESIQARRERYLESVRTGEPEARKPRERGTRSVAVERLDPGEEVEAAYELTAPRRGMYPRSAMDMEAGGLFGSARWRRRLRVEDSVLVFPRIVPIEWFPLERRTSAPTADSFEWARKGIGQDYFGVREYASGDSLRHIHWKSSARQGRLIVKEYQQEFRPTAGLVVALFPPGSQDPDVNSLEDGLRAAASIAGYLHAAGIPPWMVVPDGGSLRFIEPRSLFDSLEPLALYRAPDGGDHLEVLRQTLQFARVAASPGSSLALVTNLPAEPVLPLLEGIDGNTGLTAVLVLDESYGPGWDAGLAEARRRQVCMLAGANLNLLAVVQGMELSSCLSEPLSVIA
ncbi:MAG: DUF58 domain-containing protein [Actinobacteria bacterium]|nr:DUF58 domain-containing protein [Actinomycetota bacterium]MBU1942197.1 DUF58 domain-containing protein [Actinomycetota bacterium]MBU2688038.1 DUF58 domain-containing protein [Actinomycetota bacterium]